MSLFKWQLWKRLILLCTNWYCIFTTVSRKRFSSVNFEFTAHEKIQAMESTYSVKMNMNGSHPDMAVSVLRVLSIWISCFEWKFARKAKTCLNITPNLHPGHLYIPSPALGIFHCLFPKALNLCRESPLLTWALCYLLPDLGSGLNSSINNTRTLGWFQYKERTYSLFESSSWNKQALKDKWGPWGRFLRVPGVQKAKTVLVVLGALWVDSRETKSVTWHLLEEAWAENSRLFKIQLTF